MPSKADLKTIQSDLRKWDATRERALEISRSVTRLAAWAIVQIHRKQFSKAKATIRDARAQLDELETVLGRNPEFRQYGNVVVAYQEYAEAVCLLGLSQNRSIPSKRLAGVDSIPYVLGLLDFTGEVRRMTLDKIRSGKTKEAEELLALMEGIYEDLLSLDHTGAIPNFRRKMDVARKLIEITRGDVGTDFRRVSLEKSIRSLEKRLGER